jgi:mono/diheme cytochrome c family protein
MNRFRLISFSLSLCYTLSVAQAQVHPQGPPPAAATTAPAAAAPAKPAADGPGAGFAAATGQVPDWILIPAYKKPVVDPVAAERGRTLFVANGCSFCHGADARGGNGGPNLLRSQSVLRDMNGEVIATPIRKGVTGTTMVAFTLKDAEIADIAHFLHGNAASGYDPQRLKPATFTMGDAKSGQKYFARRCASCHQADGDLKGIATRIDKPRSLQQHWLVPRTATPRTATVTLPDGSTLAGAVVRLDEFLVTLKLADGTQRTLERDGDVPRVDVRDPRDAHVGLLPSYRDSDIHDVTAYLATLK